MRSNAVKALIVACIFMLFYIWFRFKDIRTYLTDRVMLLLQVKERALFGTDAGNFHTQVGLGVRLIIN